jgi:hypothetical protein
VWFHRPSTALQCLQYQKDCWSHPQSPKAHWGVVVTFVTSLLRLETRKFVSLMGKCESSSFQRNSEKARHFDYILVKARHFRTGAWSAMVWRLCILPFVLTTTTIASRPFPPPDAQQRDNCRHDFGHRHRRWKDSYAGNMCRNLHKHFLPSDAPVNRWPPFPVNHRSAALWCVKTCINTSLMDWITVASLQ